MAKAPLFEGLHPEMRLADAAKIVLVTLFDAAFAEAPAVLHAHDTEATHDMRVALRRLRSGLESFARAYRPKAVRERLGAMRRLGRRLGDVRDTDVHLAALRAALTGATTPEMPGIGHAIESAVARRRRSLAAFAVELSQFDREGFREFLADAGAR